MLITVQAPIQREKELIEKALSTGLKSDGIGRTGPAGFIIESDNVSLEVVLLLDKFHLNLIYAEHQTKT